MKAMVLSRISQVSENKIPLDQRAWPDPVPGEGEVLLKASACGVCHTELDEIEGRTPPPVLPVIPGPVFFKSATGWVPGRTCRNS
jgi:alcohol dehydrogenase, propanol-preferring